MEEQFPPNSEKSKQPSPEEKKVERVVSETATRRKKGVGKQFKQTFINGDAKSSVQYAVFQILVPGLMENLVNAMQDGLERWVFGESKHRRSGARSATTTNTPYHRMGPDPQKLPPRTMSQRGRARHDFDEIVLESRGEAAEVIDTLTEVVSRWGEVSVADLYTMVGIRPTHADEAWGWTDLRDSEISRFRGSYMLDLPDPEPLGR